MNRIFLDTNAYTALLTGNEEIAQVLAASEAVMLSPVVIGELLDGFAGGSRERRNRDILDGFLAKPRTVCVPITESTAEWFALIKRQLRKKGNPIPMNDVWIAAGCMEHGAGLMSFDTHFTHIEGLLLWKR